MGQGLILQAGWADLIGRILAALDEVGAHRDQREVIAVEDGCVHLEDGRDVERTLLWWQQDRDEAPSTGAKSGSCSPGQHHRALLDAVPFGEHQGLIVEEGWSPSACRILNRRSAPHRHRRAARRRNDEAVWPASKDGWTATSPAGRASRPKTRDRPALTAPLPSEARQARPAW